MKNTARDFPEIYKSLGIDTARMGCIMIDTEPLPESLVPPVEWGYTDPDAPYVRGFEPASKPHATLLYGLLKKGSASKPHIDKVLGDWEQPESITVSEVEFFDTPEAMPYQPVVLRVDESSHEALLDAHNRLSLLPHIDTFPGYKSHVTIGYIKKEHVAEATAFFADAIGQGLTLSVKGLNYGD